MNRFAVTSVKQIALEREQRLAIRFNMTQLAALELWSLGLLVSVILSSEGLADDPRLEQPAIEYVVCRLHVTDSEAIPVSEATIRPVGFRTVAERGSHWSWVPERHGPLPTAETDDQGNASISVPKYVVEKLVIGEVSWVVEHADYVTYYGDHSVADEPAKIVLADGFRIAAKVVHKDTGQPITNDIHGVLSGSSRSSTEWTLSPSGTLVSRVMDFDRTHMRVVQLPDDRPALFSELIEVRAPEGSDRVFVRQIALEKGARIEGVIDQQVPRPIERGHVCAFVSAVPGDQESPRTQTWSWYDKTSIQEDGRFVFASLPRGEVVQLLAVCDGWISRDPTNQELEASVPWIQEIAKRQRGERCSPQVYLLDQPTQHITMDMQPTATCEIVVVGPDGTPLADARASMWPNQTWYRGGSTIVGVGFRSADLLRQRTGRLDVDWLAMLRRFEAKTDKQGVAIITNLPGKGGIGLAVEHHAYELPINGQARDTSVSLKPGETCRLTIEMQAKGTDVLGQ